MAQLVERLVRNEEASGSNPLISTKKDLKRLTRFRSFLSKPKGLVCNFAIGEDVIAVKRMSFSA